MSTSYGAFDHYEPDRDQFSRDMRWMVRVFPDILLLDTDEIANAYLAAELFALKEGLANDLSKVEMREVRLATLETVIDFVIRDTRGVKFRLHSSHLDFEAVLLRMQRVRKLPRGIRRRIFKTR